jgi:RNA-splicing ligase RtcB
MLSALRKDDEVVVYCTNPPCLASVAAYHRLLQEGYGVPVGSVIVTDRGQGTGGAVAMGPVGFDIGCGMMVSRSPTTCRG